jgi:hypothetical protein
VVAGLADFFVGGVQALETKWRLGQDIEAADVGSAALDVVVIAASVKLVRAVRAAKMAEPGVAAARAGGFSSRVAMFGSRVLAGGGRLGVAVARYGAVPAAIYLMVRYPSLANATLAELAGWLGVEPWIVQFLFWFVVVSVLLRLVLLLLRPVSGVLRGLAWLTGSIGAWGRPQRRFRRVDPTGI